MSLKVLQGTDALVDGQSSCQLSHNMKKHHQGPFLTVLAWATILLSVWQTRGTTVTQEDPRQLPPLEIQWVLPLWSSFDIWQEFRSIRLW